MAALTLITAGTQLPAPPYPPDVKFNGYRFELDLQRAQQSDTWAVTPSEIRPWLLMLWAQSWLTVPCGSFTNDDLVIAARIGMPINLFRAHRDVLMRGWQLHADGKLYHHVVTQRVNEMLQRRNAEADRKAKWRANKKQAVTENVPRDTYGTDAGATAQVKVLVQEQVIKSKERSRDSATRGTRFAQTTAPENWIDYCRSKRPDLDPVDTFERFRDHWIAQPGQKGVKTDWHATWRNWVKNQFMRTAIGRPSGRSAGEQTAEAFMRVLQPQGDDR